MAELDLIGVVTVTYNSADVLPDFLRCMAEQTHSNFILYAIDNASKDDTLRILTDWGDVRLRLIANPDNRGVAAGNNQGIQAALEAGCSSVLLINNDTEFEPELIAKLDEGLAKHSVEMTCPKIVLFDEPQRIWAAGGFFQPWVGYRSIHQGEGEIDRGQYDKARLVTYVPTCCVLIQNQVFNKIGLMDELYFVYSDDTDFMYRSTKAGIRLMYLPEAKLLHKVGSLTGGEESAFAMHYGPRNSTYYLLKHFGVVRALPWIMIRQLFFLGKFLVNRKGMRWLWIKQRAIISAFTLYSKFLATTRTSSRAKDPSDQMANKAN